MHQPAQEPRRSIYYDYQVMRPWLASEHPQASHAKVVIVGAGPAGLTTALELARHGVPSVVLESELQVSEGSRAIVFTRRTLEILQQVGVAPKLMENGLPWCYGNSYFRGQRVFRMENPREEDDRYFPMLNIQQQYLEQYLLEAIAAQPLIQVRWGNRVASVQNLADGVRISVDTPHGEYEMQADWLVATDGARSVVRSALGLKMEGTSYEGRFVIADIRVDLPLPTERLAFFDPAWNPGNTVLVHREPHGIWRIDYQLPANETPEQALTLQSLSSRINAVLEMVGYPGKTWELDWSSVYSARTLTLPDYLCGHVLFAGDAAHLLPIFGVRGANTGFQDAQSLAWHLAFVVKGLASTALLRNYSAERVAAAREIIDEAGKSTRFMAPPSRGFRLLRDAVLSLSLTQAFVRPLYHWRTSRPHEYTHSALNCVYDDTAMFTGGPGHGAPPRNVKLGHDDYLLDHVGGGFDLLYFWPEPEIPDAIRQVVQAVRGKGLPLRITAVGAVHPVQGADQTLTDADGRLARCYGVNGPGAAYMLRPDQHICARWKNLDATRLRQALDAVLSL
jgi:3-(3-hydroxy-phenyl)propionate hydroxylase